MTATAPTSPELDSVLLDRARAGDTKALTELLERHQAQIYRFGMKMCRDPEDAKDVLQDTLLALARGVQDFRGDSSLSTWLFSVARSYCIKKGRRSKFAPERPRSIESDAGTEVAALSDPSTSPDDALEDKRIGAALDAAIAELEPMYREVLLLRDVEGLTAPEVASALDLSVQAVKSRLHRARTAVRARLAPLLAEPAAAPAAPGTCPDVVTLFSEHLEGDLDSNTCAVMEQHLASCPRCRGTCDSLKRTLALCRTSAPTYPVPPAVQASVRVALRDFLGETR